MPYTISKAAADDWKLIVQYTLDNFGETQVQRYTQALIKCLSALADGTGKPKTMSVAGHRVLVKHCNKHYIFALQEAKVPLLVLAILHERMDLIQRLKGRLR